MQWVMERDSTPARVEESGSPGILHIDFEGYTGEETLERISWDEFLTAFEEADLAFFTGRNRIPGFQSSSIEMNMT